MDIASLVGVVLAWSLVVVTILLGGEIGMFVNAPSLVIVVGGSLAAVMTQFTMPQFIGSWKSAGIAYLYKETSTTDLINQIIEAAQLVRKEGLLALEGIMDDIESDFLRKGLQMGVDGQDAHIVSAQLSSEMMLALGRHEIAQKMFSSWGDLAPALGMVGTLIGLVQMLANMSDPAAIGPAMAVALLTTLYGALIANLLAIPISKKLELRTEQERVQKALIIEGISSIQEGINPRVIQESLLNYLPKGSRAEFED
ncbi:MAG: flagellar motor protein PomA [Thiotrichales bacterium]|jgi:chemotaxis protein MotA|nr:flagellar motor protein PomA [Thiotrichales bacterium]MBT3612969.1 flagellar motor protein PomA [Thiotrichales bacterium]MBT4262349.1 flagellar motor protein PomA [Thiotrichales bacterium]MBT4971430.1 flagellar motor protein PomA [Thiotrichales bacterium]MBT5291295.1 flagellar motor protein PomA [Thiotrichales bacterium]